MIFRIDDVEVDEQFPDLIIFSHDAYQEIKGSDLFKNQELILQDKSYFYLVEYLKNVIPENCQMIDSRTGCGNKLPYLLKAIGKGGKLFTFETRPNRIQAALHKVNGQPTESEFCLFTTLSSPRSFYPRERLYECES